MGGVARFRVLRMRAGERRAEADDVAVEEPLEIRVAGLPSFVTMRTPGFDTDLVLGWLVAQGAVRAPRDVARVRERRSGSGLETAASVEVSLADGVVPPPPRAYPATSACGVCGADATAFVAARAPRSAPTADGDAEAARVAGPIDPAVLAELPDRMRAAQRGFARTGGLHAAGLFDLGTGDAQVVREDVGRHNAVDKVVGWALREGRLPATRSALVVSGRASFELVEKAAMAGVPALVAVSAPSSMAVELARAVDLTLTAFVRDGALSVYAGERRLSGEDPRG